MRWEHDMLALTFTRNLWFAADLIWLEVDPECSTALTHAASQTAAGGHRNWMPSMAWKPLYPCDPSSLMFCLLAPSCNQTWLAGKIHQCSCPLHLQSKPWHPDGTRKSLVNGCFFPMVCPSVRRRFLDLYGGFHKYGEPQHG